MNRYLLSLLLSLSLPVVADIDIDSVKDYMASSGMVSQDQWQHSVTNDGREKEQFVTDGKLVVVMESMISGMFKVTDQISAMQAYLNCLTIAQSVDENVTQDDIFTAIQKSSETGEARYAMEGAKFTSSANQLNDGVMILCGVEPTD